MKNRSAARLQRRLDRRRQRKTDVQIAQKLSDEELIRMAAEPVPTNSGMTEFGQGIHVYMKSNTIDGSTRCFRFRKVEAALRAQAAGIAADFPIAI